MMEWWNSPHENITFYTLTLKSFALYNLTLTHLSATKHADPPDAACGTPSKPTLALHLQLQIKYNRHVYGCISRTTATTVQPHIHCPLKRQDSVACCSAKAFFSRKATVAATL